MVFAAGPRLRAILIVAVLALAALGAGTILLGRNQGSGDAAPGKDEPAPSTPAPKPRQTTPPTAADDLPAPIAQALAENRVVVVSLYAPKAKIDALATREAAAGAQLAGAVFVAIDVSSSQVDSLNRRYGALQDPAVLVLRPPGDLIVRIDGFADRDTIAQAAANAAA